MEVGDTPDKPQTAGLQTVFLSYTHADRGRAEEIIAIIRQAGFNVWWDGLIGGGARFGDITEEKLQQAKAVVVLWSASSIKSHWVKDEATWGRDKERLIPVSIDGTEPPLGFRQVQFLDVSRAGNDTSHPAFIELVRALERLHGISKGGDEADEVLAEGAGAASLGAAATPRRKITVDRRAAIVGGATLGVAAVGLAGWKLGLFGGNTVSNSIAVLPFARIGVDEEQAIFADGLAAEVRAQLARNPLLRVAAQVSSNSFTETEEDAKSICRALGVAYLLGGNVRIAGDRVRVVAELTDGKTGFSPWTETYEQELDDIFAIQGAIASSVVRQLSAQMDDSGANANGQVGGTTSIAAYDAYLRGLELYDSGTDESTDRQALAKFDEAISIDPQYAAAHAAKGRVLTLIGNLYAGPEERKGLYDTAIAAADTAAGIAPKFADAHLVKGYAIVMGRLDMRSASKPYEDAYELGKGDADILSRYASFQARIGEDAKASAAIEAASGLDPLNARTFRNKGNIAYDAGSYNEALAAFEQAQGIQENLSSYHYFVGSTKLMLGDLEGAKADFEAESFPVWRLTGGAIVEHLLDNQAKAESYLEELQQAQGDKSNYQYAQIYAQWGRIEEALAALAAAWRLRDSGLVQLYRDPLLKPLERTSAFRDLVARMGFV